MEKGSVAYALYQQMRLWRFVISMDESLAWHTGMVLNSLKFKRSRGGWLLVVQAQRGKQHLVTFVWGADQSDALRRFIQLWKGRNIDWKEDKYPPNVGP